MASNSRPSVERAGDRDKALETALVQIERQFGKGSVMRLGQETHVPVAVIPTGSISLDVALGIGGLPRGRIVEIYGPESSGKTTVALHAVANAQKAGGIAAFIDAEHALDPDYAKRLGVDTDALLVSQPDTGEQALEIMDMLIRSGAIDIVVVDSVAALVPKAEIEGEMGDSHVGLQARELHASPQARDHPLAVLAEGHEAGQPGFAWPWQSWAWPGPQPDGAPQTGPAHRADRTFPDRAFSDRTSAAGTETA